MTPPSSSKVEELHERIAAKLCTVMNANPYSIGGHFIRGAINEAIHAALELAAETVQAEKEMHEFAVTVCALQRVKAAIEALTIPSEKPREEP